jgi:hypothetical protein
MSSDERCFTITPTDVIRYKRIIDIEIDTVINDVKLYLNYYNYPTLIRIQGKLPRSPEMP